MVQHKRQRLLRVRLMEMSDQSRDILNYYFSSSGGAYFHPVTAQDQADVFVFDYDYPGAAEEWHRISERYQAPTIIFSVRKVALPRCVWVPKPLTVEGMNRAARDIAEQWSEGPPGNGSSTTLGVAPGVASGAASSTTSGGHASTRVAQGASANDQLPVLTRVVSSAKLSAKTQLTETKTTKQASDGNSERVATRGPSSSGIGATVQSYTEQATEDPGLYRRELLCGKQADVPLNSWFRHGELFFPAGEFLSSHVIKGVRMMQDTGRIISVMSPPFEFFVFSGLNRIYSNFSIKETNTVEMFSQPVDKEYVKIKAANATELRRIIARIKAKQGVMYDLEALLWSLSLLSSRGRIPLDTDLQRSAWLKFWPNFTRLETIPYCMEIAALWSQQPRSLVDTVDQLKIPQRYVIAFFNGAHALDLFDYKQPESESYVQSQFPESRGFFKGIFNRFKTSNFSQY